MPWPGGIYFNEFAEFGMADYCSFFAGVLIVLVSVLSLAPSATPGGGLARSSLSEEGLEADEGSTLLCNEQGAGSAPHSSGCAMAPWHAGPLRSVRLHSNRAAAAPCSGPGQCWNLLYKVHRSHRCRVIGTIGIVHPGTLCIGDNGPFLSIYMEVGAKFEHWLRCSAIEGGWRQVGGRLLLHLHAALCPVPLPLRRGGPDAPGPPDPGAAIGLALRNLAPK